MNDRLAVKRIPVEPPPSAMPNSPGSGISPEPTDRSRSAFIRDLPFILLVTGIALVLRLDFLLSSSFVIDGDEAIVGLMAKRMLDGKGMPVFYYGQHYMGSFEPLLAALVFRVFGISSDALQSVPLVFSLLLVPLLYLMAVELAGRSAGRLAALLWAVPPTTLVVWSSKARGGFMEIVFIGALALLLTIHWLRERSPRAASTALIWLVLGFGWWVNNQVIYFILPISLLMALRSLESMRERTESPSRWLWLGTVSLGSFLVGGLPFWTYNITHSFVSFDMFRGAGGGELLDHWTGLFRTALPIILGAQRFWDSSSVIPYATTGAFLVYGYLAFVIVSGRRFAIRDLMTLRLDRDTPIELIGFTFLSCVCVFAFSSFGYLVEAPRYLLPAYVPIFVLAAVALVKVGESSKFLAGALLAAILSLNLLSGYYPRRAVPGEPFVDHGDRVSKDHSQLIEWLTSKGESWVRTNYWIGYRLAFESMEKIRFRHASHPYHVRIREYEVESDALDPEEMPLVLTPGQARMIQRGLSAMGLEYSAIDLSGYRVIYDIHAPGADYRKVPSEKIAVSATHGAESARAAVDGDPATRWGSAHPQATGMRYEVRFTEPTTIRGLQYALGDWAVDFPRAMIVELILPGGERKPLWRRSDYRAIGQYLEYGTPRHAPDMHLYMEPTTVEGFDLVQLGNHPVLDWSIAELTILE